MPLFLFKRISILCLALSTATGSAFAATPQEDAFLKVWGAHVRTPQDHQAVIAVCQSVMDRSSTLGEFLPVVETLAAWHLLAAGKRDDAVRIFESALVTDKAAKSLARFSDTMARRWLTRLDAVKIEKALHHYYTDNVEYPSGLGSLLSLPGNPTLPKNDRFGDPWVYATESFSKLRKTANQRYALSSKNLGSRLSALGAFPFNAYGGKKSATILMRRTAAPVSVEFETVTEAGTRRGVATESGLVNGIRFLKLSSDGRFALMIDSECDFWVVATPARSR